MRYFAADRREHTTQVGDRLMQDDLRSRRLTWLIVTVITLTYTCAAAWLARCQSHFVGDDLTNFYWAETLPVFDFLLLPADAHLSPLHRLATLVLQTVAPWNFDAALAILMLTHLVGVFCLCRLVELIWNDPLAPWLAAWCGCNVFLGFQFTWWSSGSHRLPCITLSILAVYYYWRFRGSGQRTCLAYSYAAFAAALGFFSKALLVPPLLMGMELLAYDRPGRGNVRARIALIGLMALSAIATAFVTLSAIGADAAVPTLPARTVWAIEGTLTKVFFGCFGVVSRFDAGHAGWLFVAGLLAAFLWSVAVSRWYFALWATFTSCVVLANITLPMMAPRSAAWLLVASSHSRYLYGIYFQIAIAVALLAAYLTAGGRNLPTHSAFGWRARIIVLSLLMIAYASVSLRSFDLATSELADRGKARTYLTNLMHDLDRMVASADSTIRIAPGRLPRFVTIGPRQMTTVGELATFLPLLDPRAQVVSPLQADYRVSDEGHLIRADH